MPRTVMTIAEATAFLEEVFPAVRGKFELLDLPPMGARVRMKVGPQNIRPGGTVSGPAMFWSVDCAFYIALLGMIGKVPLVAIASAISSHCSGE